MSTTQSDKPEAIRLAEYLDGMAQEIAVEHYVGDMDLAAAELRRQHAEVERLRELAATCYAGLGAECNLPEAWLDALNAAANGESFSTEGLLPFTANGPTEGDTFRALVSFLLVTEDPIAFLRCWNEGDFEACRKEWPEAPDELYPPP